MSGMTNWVNKNPNPNTQPPLTNTALITNFMKTQGTNAYQLSIPNPSQVGIERTMRFLNSPYNQDIFNQFMPQLINFISRQLVHSKVFTNPMTPFKRQQVFMNQGVQEIGFQLLEARAYDVKNVSAILDVRPPEARTAYHSVNYKYENEMTINRELLMQSFLQENGLSQFVSGAMQALYNKDNLDEYNAMLNLIASYEKNYGFYKIQVPEVTDMNPSQMTEYQLKAFVQATRSLLLRWQVDLTGMYNAWHLPTHVQPSEAILITTPEIMAAVDVNVLASAFNMDKTNFTGRVFIVKEIPIENCYALLVDENWFFCGDSMNTTESFYNPATLSINYFLHHWAMHSVSPMLNAVAFVTTPGTVNPVLTVTPGEFNVNLYGDDGAVANEIVLGEANYLKGSLSWTGSPENKNLPDEFIPTIFKITEIGVPAQKQRDESATANTTIPDGNVSVVAATFGNAVGKRDGAYVFTYHGDHWHMGASLVELDTFGITVNAGTPAVGNTITVEYLSAQEDREASTLALNSRTFVGDDGQMHFQAAVQPGMTVTVEGSSTYDTNGVPGAREYKKTVSFNIATE